MPPREILTVDPDAGSEVGEKLCRRNVLKDDPDKFNLKKEGTSCLFP